MFTVIAEEVPPELEGVNGGPESDKEGAAAACVTATVAVLPPAETVTVALRCAPVFALAVIVNELVLLETVSHDWLELTVQLLWLVLTVTEAVLLVLAGLHDELESDRVAAG